MPKITFRQRGKKRFLVLRDGVPCRRDDKILIIKRAQSGPTRRMLGNAGHRPPPPLPPLKQSEPIGEVTAGYYSTMWDNTHFDCPWCGEDDYNVGRFAGPVQCIWCSRSFTVILSADQPARRASLENIGVDPDW